MRVPLAMNNTMHPFLVATLVALSSATAQNTVPHWSSYFGAAADHDMAMVVKLGPGSLLTVVGHSAANGLGTPGSYRPAITGPAWNVDAFVARFDTSLPPAQQRLWCTYFGGDGMDLAFDAEVDGTGAVTIVGMTMSGAPSFPVVNGFQTTLKGASDGFVARIDATGANLVYSTYLGGDGDDRLLAIEMAPGGNLVVAGITEASGLPATAGTVGPVFLGGTDVFVARLEPGQPSATQLPWATYVGGAYNEGPSFSAWAGWNAQWVGVLDSVDLVLHANGDVAVVTPSSSPTAPTTPGCLQSVHGGGPAVNNVYLVRLSAQATVRQYATFFGAAGNGARAMAAHPAGGYVIVGQAVATNFPTTPNCYQPTHLGGPFGGATDGILCWIDPASPGQLRYSTYIGGDGGEDGMVGVAVESSGIVTVTGYLSGGGLTSRTTPGCLQPTSNAFEYTGYLARLAMLGQGAKDLVYATYLGDVWTVMQSVALDDVGDAIVVGMSSGAGYPTTLNAWQPVHSGPGMDDAVITHLPLMAGGTTRFDGPFATPACPQRLYHGAYGPPKFGNFGFGLTATNAPPLSFGVLAFGFAPLPGGPVAVPTLGINVLVSPAVLFGVSSDALGFARYTVPVPTGTAVGLQLFSQWAFFTNAACPGSGWLSASEGLVFTTF
ncbi:MAG: hypothetical protein WAT39_25115 [Planctomycetota bacterium]